MCANHKVSIQYCEIHEVGLALDYCVKDATVDLSKNVIDVSVVYDATSSVNLEPEDLAKSQLSDEQKALNDLKAIGVKIITSKEVLDIKPNHNLSQQKIEMQLRC